ncbi:MAG: redoxin domain-containing protein, partial [Candidatus Eisenbacteria bacterium]|nr:redoxin domain-containing protein [Candidatus Eisenbacteria bacterium]
MERDAAGSAGAGRDRSPGSRGPRRSLPRVRGSDPRGPGGDRVGAEVTRKIRSPIWWATWAVAIGLLLCVPPHASALAPGDPAPAFRLPSIIEGEAEVGSEIFAEAPVTVLIIWDRGCSHCRSVALQSTVLSDSLLPMGGQVFGILLGPDDPQILRDLLWDKEIVTPHLWDYARKSASAYELGFRHIGIFVIDRGGTIRAAFDDKVPDLISPVMPVARVVVRAEAPEGDKPRPVDRGAAEEDRTQPAEQGASQEAGSLRPVRMAARPEAGNFASPSGWPALRVDGRMRLISTEGARPFDTGLYGEELQNGALLLHRWDLRLAWNLARGITFEPWLRVSNEDEAYLTEGAEQLSSRHGTATLRMQSGAFSAALGAYALRVSPFALQRWDAEDAPPIGGGASGCGCGPGSGGVSYRSQEILGPDYTFEGASASWTHRYARVRGFIAIPRWEQAAVQEGDAYQSREPRFRRILHGGVIDFGKAGTEERAYGLASPVGLRLGFVGA